MCGGSWPPAAVLPLADRVRHTVERGQRHTGEPRRAILAPEKRRHRLARKQAPKIDRTLQNPHRCVHIAGGRAGGDQHAAYGISPTQPDVAAEIAGRFVIGSEKDRFEQSNCLCIRHAVRDESIVDVAMNDGGGSAAQGQRKADQTVAPGRPRVRPKK